jgi:hypothetical protein
MHEADSPNKLSNKNLKIKKLKTEMTLARWQLIHQTSQQLKRKVAQSKKKCTNF